MFARDDQKDQLGGRSAGLPTAAWAAWFARGVWPDQPVALSGCLAERADRVEPTVERVADKLHAVRDQGVRWLVVPAWACPTNRRRGPG